MNCPNCGHKAIIVPKVFAKDKHGRLFFCDNEACLFFEMKFEELQLQTNDDDITWN